METFIPSTTAPQRELLASIEKFLREGHPILHDPAPPAWATGDPCPAGHFSLPEGIYLHQYEQRQELNPPYLLLSIDGPSLRHVPDDDRLWDIPVSIFYVESADTLATNDPPAVIRELTNDLFADAAISTTKYPAPARLNRDPGDLTTSPLGLRVFYFYDIEEAAVTMENGHPAHLLKAKVRCSGVAA